MQSATRWEDRANAAPYPSGPSLDFDNIPGFGFNSGATALSGAFDGLGLWSGSHLGLPDYPSGSLAVNSVLFSDYTADGLYQDGLIDSASDQPSHRDLQASHLSHGMEMVPVPCSATVPGDGCFVPENVAPSALYPFGQFTAEGGGDLYDAFPSHVSPADIFFAAPSPLCNTSLALGPSSTSPPIYSPDAATPPSYADELQLSPVSPAAGSEWTMYSPSAGSSSATGSSTLYSADPSPIPVFPDTPPNAPMRMMERGDVVHGKRAARRRRPQPTASLSVGVPSSLTSSFSGKPRATAPRNKQVRYEPYEVPDGAFDKFVCPHCEPGRPFSTPRRRTKHDIVRHLKTHFTEASRSSSKAQFACDRIVPIEDLPGPNPPKKWYNYEGREVVGKCGMLFGRSDSLLRHLDGGCLGPKES